MTAPTNSPLSETDTDHKDTAQVPSSVPGQVFAVPTGTERVSALKSATQFISLAVKEWFQFLLDQPAEPLFTYQKSFGDESQRVARLLVIVVFLNGLILGTSRLVLDKEGTLSITRTSLGILCGSLLIALFYKPVASTMGIPITLRQTVFTVLYIGLPWLPVLCFIWGAVLATSAFLRIALLVSYYICFMYVTVNFIKAVKILTRKSSYRVAFTVYGPVVLILAFLLFRC